MRLKDKVAIVTGAASGMGAATARLFAAEGARVVVADVLDEDGKQVVAEIERDGGQARFAHLDVTSEADWSRTVADTISAWGRLDVLVNNAGISGSGYDDVTDTDGWNRLMGINATGCFFGMKYCAPPMVEAGHGSIVNISSISGVVGQGFIHFGYNASKGAVRTMTKSAADRYGPKGVRVNSVHPGLMPPMRTSGKTADPATREKMLKRVPLRRAGRVEEVAYASLFLASDEASYVTGAELVVDGGHLAT
ncbi:MAG: glucose 1-dehydrogenase [Gammaproteobacteria bacterium]|nr:glucose 1-dehydrogenase [Gammaproteobacteria bacterium]